MTVGLGVGLAASAGIIPTTVVAQAGVATVAATARVVPAVGALPSEVGAIRAAGGTRHSPGLRGADGAVGRALPSRAATTVTRQVMGNRCVIEVAATGV